jgi:uncharacterized protein YjbJ (UPF0337 family)
MSETANEKAHDVVDTIGGEGTSDKIEGKLQEVTGSAKSAIGDYTNDPELQVEGEAQKSEGLAQQVVGNAKHLVSNVADAISDGAHKLGDAISNATHKE